MSGLLKSNLAVATGTAMSRITGLVRVAVLGAVLGAPSALADAYDLANGTPNMIYELLVGGVLSSSLVPLFTRLHEEKDRDGTSAVVTVSLIVMAAITAAAVLAAPLVFRLYSLLTSAAVDAGKYREVGTLLARIFLVQIFFYGINTLASALLNARKRFFAAAWVPTLANVVTIASLFLVSGAAGRAHPTLDDVLEKGGLQWILGGGATLGIVAMAVALLPSLAAARVRLRFKPDFRHPAVKRLRALSGWALGYVVANQIAIVVIRNLLRGGSGSVFSYSRAYMWFVLPHGLLGVSIATTFLPDMTRSITRKDKDQMIRQSALGVRLIALVTLPAGFGLFVLRRPIIGAAFEHGGVTSADALETSRALAGFALGLAGFSIYLFVIRVFYAHQDAKSPFKINLVENAINIVLAILLVDRYGVLGLGIAFAVAYVVTAAWSLQVLSYKVPGYPLRQTFAGLYRMTLAAAIMAEAVWLITRFVGGNTGIDAVVRIAVGTIAGAAIYVGVLFALGAPEIKELRQRVAR